MPLKANQKIDNASLDQSLEKLFWPDSVAIVGAAPAGKHRTRGRFIAFLKGAGYSGRIYPINPSYQEVDGLPCFPTVEAIGAHVDVAILALPASAIPDALENCARAGTSFAIVVSAGFIEEGEEGARLQSRIVEIAARTGIRICGPNCQGLFNALGNVTMTFSPTVDPKTRKSFVPISARRVGIIAQSGGIGYSLATRAESAGLGLSYVASTGNEAGLTSADYLDYMVDDPRTDAVLLFCETVRDPKLFVAALARAQRIGKPVIVLKVGRSEAARRAAASHTAALTGWDAGYRATFDRYDVLQADHPDEAIALAGLLLTCPVPRGNRAGIITVTGGGGALMSDMLTANGLLLPELSPVTQDAIHQYIPKYGATANPVDVTVNSAEMVMPTIELLERSADVDIVVVVTQLASEDILPLDPVRLRPIVDRQTKPIVLWTYTSPSAPGLRSVEESGLFLSLDLHNCGRAVGMLANYGLRKANPPVLTLPRVKAAPLPSGLPRIVTEYECKKLLSSYGFPAAREKLVQSADAAAQAAATLGFPVVLKIQSSDIPHKTEAGGVRLGLCETAAVSCAYEEVLASGRRYKPDAKVDGVLVQAMAPKGYEIVVGMLNDETFGPIMMVGLGGISVELYGDVVHRPAPVSPAEVVGMLRKLKSSKLFGGFRGAAPVDLQPVAEFVSRMSQAAVDHEDAIGEMEFNPVILHADGSGLTVADALMILRDSDGTRRPAQ